MGGGAAKEAKEACHGQNAWPEASVGCSCPFFAHLHPDEARVVRRGSQLAYCFSQLVCHGGRCLRGAGVAVRASRGGGGGDGG